MGQVFVLILSGLILVAAGAGVGYWFGAGGRQRSKADALQKEFDEYRERVGQHFATSAEHFKTIGREYRALYHHMASGAEALCDATSADERLSFDPEPAPVPGEPPASADSGTDDEAGNDDAPDQASDGGRNRADSADSDADYAELPDIADTVEKLADDAAARPDGEDSTPETRARDAGGESAPAEPGTDEAADDSARPITNDGNGAVADAAPGEGTPADIPVESSEDAKRVYH